VIQAATAARPRIYPISARRAVTGIDGGFAAFLTAFDRYLTTERAGDVERAVAGHADRLTRRLLDEVRLTLHAAQMRSAAAADRVAAFRTVLTDVARRRQDAGDLLGLDLAVPTTTERLLPAHEFVTSYAEDVGQTELLAGAIRRRLPGEFGRNRVREYVRRQVADLVLQQIGRSRADIQYRLSESTHRLLAAVERLYRESSERLLAALDDAHRLAAETPEARRSREQLKQREAALLGPLNRLGQVMAASREPVWTHRSTATAEPADDEQHAVQEPVG
jgi:hypothetical protein